MSARALAGIVAAGVLLFACSQRVQIGAEEDPPITLPTPTPMPTPVNVCAGATCGATCTIPGPVCTSDTCPPSMNGYCSEGMCGLAAPTCTTPTDSCAGLACGVVCPDTPTSPDPNDPPPLAFCDGAGHCVMGPSPCGPCAGKACGDPCGPCDPADPACDIDGGTPGSVDGGPPTGVDGGPQMMCDALQQCQVAPPPCP